MESMAKNESTIDNSSLRASEFGIPGRMESVLEDMGFVSVETTSAIAVDDHCG